MPDKDVTALVNFGWNYEELLPITECVCGHRFKFFDFFLGVHRDQPHSCPYCGRKLYFGLKVTVYEVEEESEGKEKTND